MTSNSDNRGDCTSTPEPFADLRFVIEDSVHGVNWTKTLRPHSGRGVKPRTRPAIRTTRSSDTEGSCYSDSETDPLTQRRPLPTRSSRPSCTVHGHVISGQQATESNRLSSATQFEEDEQSHGKQSDKDHAGEPVRLSTLSTLALRDSVAKFETAVSDDEWRGDKAAWSNEQLRDGALLSIMSTITAGATEDPQTQPTKSELRTRGGVDPEDGSTWF
jgi:hypothetical protein